MDQADSRTVSRAPAKRVAQWLWLLAQLGCADDVERERELLDATIEVDAGSAAADASALDWTRDAAGDLADARFAGELARLPYARLVASFDAGANAGFGRERFPEVVLGPPRGLGTEAGSLDVLSLGVGGEIVLDFAERPIVDGPGADFIVFENPFWPGGRRERVFAELGEVAVGDELGELRSFPCARAPLSDGSHPGCAGWTPTQTFDPFELVPLDPRASGGDAFDLAQLGLTRARYVRIRDLSLEGGGNNGGFDLDAVGVIHAQ